MKGYIERHLHHRRHLNRHRHRRQLDIATKKHLLGQSKYDYLRMKK
jgi:hypothetical protein